MRAARQPIFNGLRLPARILVTRPWYIREADPYEKIFTGMTRDGTFLAEDGQVTAGLRNFHFNESLIEMLSNVEAMSEPARARRGKRPSTWWRQPCKWAGSGSRRWRGFEGMGRGRRTHLGVKCNTE